MSLKDEWVFLTLVKGGRWDMGQAVTTDDMAATNKEERSDEADKRSDEERITKGF
ncbi:hypothetical protein FoTM2_017361 [Fusarium oxysporum f. sp. vasinfectum]|uniref:Uncharacterized protein n=1 Tax=Fusarium oxysporum f. sp. vasinfectum 25433 TaxID=1089449 RepID=X0KX14_FUSOX|nr:hypothetical protein FOTG_18321 [Fusarium oxysporum f. sp. vasinfectum 25433]KAK2922508.1 hypothetical protein FoTM2_017361 [Fusarium oxysporum f. sp. vasinfectum]